MLAAYLHERFLHLRLMDGSDTSQPWCRNRKDFYCLQTVKHVILLDALIYLPVVSVWSESGSSEAKQQTKKSMYLNRLKVFWSLTETLNVCDFMQTFKCSKDDGDLTTVVHIGLLVNPDTGQD